MNLYEMFYKGMESALIALRKAISEAMKDVDFSNLKNIIIGIASLQRWMKSVDILVENQYAFTDEITEDLMNKLLNQEDVDNTIEAYYLENDKERLIGLIERCKCSIQPYNNNVLFNQVLVACERDCYHLACIGLFALIDGLLTETTNIFSTSFSGRFKPIQDKINRNTPLSELDKRLICLYYSFENIENTMFKNSGSFNAEEPPELNRHWAVHGRSQKSYDLIDCIKLFQWVEAIIIMDNYDGAISNKEE